MILWVGRGGRLTDAVHEVQVQVDMHGSIGKYASWIAKNALWKQNEGGRTWMRERWETLKQDLEIELRKRFYGYP